MALSEDLIESLATEIANVLKRHNMHSDELTGELLRATLNWIETRTVDPSDGKSPIRLLRFRT